MKLLELTIRQKTKIEIIETIEPLIYKIVEEKQILVIENIDTLYVLNHSITEDLKRLHILAQKSILNIKLKYFKRNLANLEILSDKQNLPSDITLAFRIIRENLNIQHISNPINTYIWYKIYKEKRLPNYLLKQISL